MHGKYAYYLLQCELHAKNIILLCVFTYLSRITFVYIYIYIYIYIDLILDLYVILLARDAPLVSVVSAIC